MQINDQFLSENKTKNGGFTKRQLEIIGVKWPPKKGWKAHVLGKILKSDQVKEFQSISKKSFETL